MSRNHGTTRWRECGFIVTKLSSMDACEDRKVVRWYTVQTSSHNLQGVVDGSRVSEAIVRTAAPDRSAVLCC